MAKIIEHVLRDKPSSKPYRSINSVRPHHTPISILNNLVIQMGKLRN